MPTEKKDGTRFSATLDVLKVPILDVAYCFAVEARRRAQWQRLHDVALVSATGFS
jgi:hypothetical protein